MNTNIILQKWQYEITTYYPIKILK
jgi:hypothetical protein